MAVKDGGPAFPAWKDEDRTRMWFLGMSLRDYFAGQALVGMPGQVGPRAEEQIAMMAYAIADAMLKAREATHGE